MSGRDFKVEDIQVEKLAPEGDAIYSVQLAHEGALLQEEERQLTLWQSAKFHWRPLLVCRSHISNLIHPVLTSLQAASHSPLLWFMAMTQLSTVPLLRCPPS